MVQPLQLTAGVSSHLLQVFHRKLCARKTSDQPWEIDGITTSAAPSH
jgi:hypothetical protein